MLDLGLASEHGITRMKATEPRQYDKHDEKRRLILSIASLPLERRLLVCIAEIV